MIVHDFSNKKREKLYPDLKFISHFIRNTSDLKLKTLFLICGTLLYILFSVKSTVFRIEVCNYQSNTACITVFRSLWEMLQSGNSCLAQQAVPLLLHCVCMPYGAGRLCDEIENVFNNEDWMKRFSAGINQYNF